MSTALRAIGRVKWFNSRTGYGFLTNTQTGEDVFIHHSGIQVPAGVYRNLYTGEYVEYDLHTNETGKMLAVGITGVHCGPLMCQRPRRHQRRGSSSSSSSSVSSSNASEAAPVEMQRRPRGKTVVSVSDVKAEH